MIFVDSEYEDLHRNYREPTKQPAWFFVVDGTVRLLGLLVPNQTVGTKLPMPRARP